MFTKNPNDVRLDQEIEVALKELATLRDNPEKYNAVVDRITKLDKLKSESGLKPPSVDTVLIVAANIFGVLWVAALERDHPIPKAMSHVMKAK